MVSTEGGMNVSVLPSPEGYMVDVHVNSSTTSGFGLQLQLNPITTFNDVRFRLFKNGFEAGVGFIRTSSETRSPLAVWRPNYIPALASGSLERTGSLSTGTAYITARWIF